MKPIDLNSPEFNEAKKNIDLLIRELMRVENLTYAQAEIRLSSLLLRYFHKRGKQIIELALCNA